MVNTVPHSWRHQFGTTCRCTNLSTFKHKVKEYFLCKKDRKITMFIFTTRLLSSQKLMHFFFNFSLLFVFLFLFYFIFS